MRGFQPGKARAVPQNYADGGVVSTIKGMLGFGGGKKKPEPLPADLNKMPPTGAGPAASQPEPPKKAISQYSGMSALERRMKEADAYADGGVVRGIADAVRPFSESVGGYWSNSNKEFEATSPGVGSRLVRAVNPVTGLGSAVGAMYDAAGSGSARDAAIAAAQAAPMFAAMKAVPAAKSLIPTAPQIAVATGKTAAKAAGGTGAGVAADEVQARGFANGGLVRGPGTGISDDIEDEVEDGTFIMPADSTEVVGPEVMDQAGKAVPVNLSNGETKLPPEALQAIGAQVMEAIKDVTHVPAAQQARGFPMGEHVVPELDDDDGRMNFADGGVVGGQKRLYLADAGLATQERLKREGMTVADRARSPGYSAGAGGPAPTPPAQAQAQPKPAPAPAATPRDRGMPAPEEARSSMLGEFFRDSVSEVADKANAGNLAGAFGAATRRTLQAPGMTVAAAATPALEAAGRMWDGLVGNDPAATARQPATPPATPAANTVAPPAPPAAVTPPAANGQQPGAAPKPEAKAPTLAPAPTGSEVMPGVYRQGNSYGDSPQAAATGARPSQGPNAQNMAAADALVARDRGFQPPSEPADVMGIYARASEALKGTAEAQRALDDYGPRMSGGVTANDYLTGPASAAKFQQAMYRTALEKQAQQGGRGAAAAMQALNNMEGNQIQLETAQMRERGDTARFNARESGENARSARRDRLAEELGRGQLDLQRSAQGFTTRQAERQERLYAEYDAAKTPEEQAAVARKIAALSGKAADPKDNFMVVGGGQEWDAAAGAMRNVPQRLIDLRTGQDVGATGQGGKPLPAPADPKERKVGSVYVAPNGANVRWTGQGWQQA